jgi:serine/threonine-protein kinase
MAFYAFHTGARMNEASDAHWPNGPEPAEHSGPDAACLSETVLLALAEGELSGAERRRAHGHVDTCEDCRIVLAALVRASLPHDEPLDEPTIDRNAAPGAEAPERLEVTRVISVVAGARLTVVRRAKTDSTHFATWLSPEVVQQRGEAVQELVKRLAAVDHPSLERVYRCVPHGQHLVILSEFFEGDTAASLLEDDELPASWVREVAVQLTNALATAHQALIVHGSLAPEDVFVDPTGHAVVLGFGIRYAITQEVVPVELARRADVYAIASLCMAMLDKTTDRDSPLRSVFKRAAADEKRFPTGVELERAVRASFDRSLEIWGGRVRGMVEDWIPAPGQVIGERYRVEGLVGSGGMGVVITAIQQDLGRRVAIKLLPPRAAGKRSAVERFVREARAASAIQNEHVVQIFDVGRLDNGTPYIVMEHLVGATLARLVGRSGPLPLDRALTYMLQACVGVAASHARGVIHRDIKPDNIMVLERPGQRGFVKVLDFGISKAEIETELRDSESLTGSMDVLGTPTYMAPEQIRSSKTVDARADIWALGVVLYEILTGRPPFVAANLPALSAGIVRDAPDRPTLLRRDLPLGLERIILQCLSKKPNDRPADILVLAEQLAAFAPTSAAGWVASIRGLLAPRSERPAADSLVPLPASLPPAAAVLSFVPPVEQEPRRVGDTLQRYLSRRKRWQLAIGGILAIVVVAFCLALLLSPEGTFDAPPVASASAAPSATTTGVTSLSDFVPESTGSASAPAASNNPKTPGKPARRRGPSQGPLDTRF